MDTILEPTQIITIAFEASLTIVAVLIAALAFLLGYYLTLKGSTKFDLSPYERLSIFIIIIISIGGAVSISSLIYLIYYPCIYLFWVILSLLFCLILTTIIFAILIFLEIRSYVRN